jgi:hypothetical protein
MSTATGSRPPDGNGIFQRASQQRVRDGLRWDRFERRAWCGCFGHGVSQATFGYLGSYAWHRITQWLLNGTSHLNRAELYRRFLTGGPGNRPAVGGLG